MLLKKQSMVQSKLLNKFSFLKHGFLNRFESDTPVKLFKSAPYVMVKQIHDSKIIEVKNSTIKNNNYDGMITKKKLLLAIRTADCLPVFFFDSRKKIVGAVHAGWKGLKSGILKNTINKLIKSGSNINNIYVSIGPHIGFCCYKVSKDRIDEFNKLLETDKKFYEYRKSSWYLNLGKIAEIQLFQMGVSINQIDILPICTYCDLDYFSYRREGSQTGRMLNIIGLN